MTTAHPSRVRAERHSDIQTVEVADVADDGVQRQVLPIPDRRPVGLTTYDASDSDTSFPAIRPLRPPAGAPNVLLVLVDDVGFGASSAFGGPVQMPTAERLAAHGLKYTRFHTTALCSPTRAVLLSGRNRHSVGMGGITEITTSAPRLQLPAAHHHGAVGRDPRAERLRDRAVRQVPRGAGVGNGPESSTHPTTAPGGRAPGVSHAAYITPLPL